MNAARKGSRGEDEVCSAFHALGYAAHRNEQWHVSGKGNPDVAAPGLHIEVKRQERLNLHEAFRQAASDCAADKLPVVAHRRNREEWLLTMRLHDFLFRYYNGALLPNTEGGYSAVDRIKNAPSAGTSRSASEEAAKETD